LTPFSTDLSNPIDKGKKALARLKSKINFLYYSFSTTSKSKSD